MGEQRAKSKDERLGNLRSLGSLKSLGTTQRTLCVIIGFSGLGNTLVEGTNEIENRACQVYLNKALFSILFVISARISLNAQTNSTKVFGEPFYKKAQIFCTEKRRRTTRQSPSAGHQQQQPGQALRRCGVPYPYGRKRRCSPSSSRRSQAPPVRVSPRRPP